jgi:hypothetical protein
MDARNLAAAIAALFGETRGDAREAAFARLAALYVRRCDGEG